MKILLYFVYSFVFVSSNFIQAQRSYSQKSYDSGVDSYSPGQTEPEVPEEPQQVSPPVPETVRSYGADLIQLNGGSGASDDSYSADISDTGARYEQPLRDENVNEDVETIPESQRSSGYSLAKNRYQNENINAPVYQNVRQSIQRPSQSSYRNSNIRRESKTQQYSRRNEGQKRKYEQIDEQEAPIQSDYGEQQQSGGYGLDQSSRYRDQQQSGGYGLDQSSQYRDQQSVDYNVRDDVRSNVRDDIRSNVRDDIRNYEGVRDRDQVDRSSYRGQTSEQDEPIEQRDISQDDEQSDRTNIVNDRANIVNDRSYAQNREAQYRLSDYGIQTETQTETLKQGRKIQNQPRYIRQQRITSTASYTKKSGSLRPPQQIRQTTGYFSNVRNDNLNYQSGNNQRSTYQRPTYQRTKTSKTTSTRQYGRTKAKPLGSQSLRSQYNQDLSDQGFANQQIKNTYRNQEQPQQQQQQQQQVDINEQQDQYKYTNKRTQVDYQTDDYSTTAPPQQAKLSTYSNVKQSLKRTNGYSQRTKNTGPRYNNNQPTYNSQQQQKQSFRRRSSNIPSGY